MNRIHTGQRNAIMIFMMLWMVFSSVSMADEFLPVRHVSDGDTITLQDGRSIRYIGINAPEIAHKDRPADPYGPDSQKINQEKVLSKQVRLEWDVEKTDQYGRNLAYVFLADGTFINQVMVEAGLAFFMPTRPNTRYNELLLNAQRQAMQARRGIWQGWQEESGQYVGHRQSKRFHVSSCPLGQKIARKNQISFHRKWDAYWEGYFPCKKCLGSQVNEISVVRHQ